MDIDTAEGALRGFGQILTIGPWALIVALLAMLFRERNRRRVNDNIEDRQRVELGIAMLETARDEIGRLNLELRDARVLADVQAHLDEAESLLTALISADADELDRAKRSATAFLRRMEKLREMRGVARNEVQIAVSKGRLGNEGK